MIRIKKKERNKQTNKGQRKQTKNKNTPPSYLRMEKVCSSEMLVAMYLYHNTQHYAALYFDYFVTWNARKHEIKLSKSSCTVRRTVNGQPYEGKFCVFKKKKSPAC